jgi:hypothetical protein
MWEDGKPSHIARGLDVEIDVTPTVPAGDPLGPVETPVVVVQIDDGTGDSRATIVAHRLLQMARAWMRGVDE